MSRMLKLALLIQMIVSVILGVLLLVIPGSFLTWLGWVPNDPVISRVLGAALLAMSWGDLRVWRSSAKAEARLLAEVHLGFAALTGGAVLRHLLAAALAEGAELSRLFAGGWPVMMWTVFGVFGLFALMWLWVLVKERW
jgi:hypothetical protein